jgi:hypothetical protein
LVTVKSRTDARPSPDETLGHSIQAPPTGLWQFDGNSTALTEPNDWGHRGVVVRDATAHGEHTGLRAIIPTVAERMCEDVVTDVVRNRPPRRPGANRRAYRHSYLWKTRDHETNHVRNVSERLEQDCSWYPHALGLSYALMQRRVATVAMRFVMAKRTVVLGAPIARNPRGLPQ